MFYLEAIYLPTLQRQVRLWQINYYVGLWFTQMWLYRFYIPLLIRLANDVETNPGPTFFMNSSKPQSSRVSSPMSVLEFRLSQLRLRAKDVGGDGDCLFRAVSDQLFGTAAYHLQVRAVGIEYLRNHPEQFIESNVEYSWLGYLNNMSRQGTWCDNLIIQAVATALNCAIHITETAENFAETTVVHPVNTQGRPRTIYLGHLDEIHYVSTAPIENEQINILQRQQSQIHTESKTAAMSCEQTTLVNDETQPRITQIVSPSNKKSSETPTNDALEGRKAYMRQYMKKKRADRQFRETENDTRQQKRKQNQESQENAKGKHLKIIKKQILRKSNRWTNKNKQKDENVIQTKLKKAKDNVF